MKSKYEVWGVGYGRDGNYTGYMKKYGTFDGPAEAMLFAHKIDRAWLKEHGELGEEEVVDVCVEGAYDDGTLEGEESLWIHRIEIYHRFLLDPDISVYKPSAM